MPFINIKINKIMSEGQTISIKAELGKIIEIIPGKSESRLMLNFDDGCNLYFKGNKDPAALVEIQLYGKATKEIYDTFTQKISDILEKNLGIHSSRIYVKYEEVDFWGLNGHNFK